MIGQVIQHSARNIGHWAEHWVACKLVENGWQVKFLGDAVPSYDMIAYHPEYGARSIQVKGRGKNTGSIDLGPIISFSADFIVFVEQPLTENVVAYIYPKSDVINAVTIEGAGDSAFVCNPGIVKKTSKQHVWTHRRNHPRLDALEAWEQLKK
jgi:hypothetical protein